MFYSALIGHFDDLKRSRRPNFRDPEVFLLIYTFKFCTFSRLIIASSLILFCQFGGLRFRPASVPRKHKNLVFRRPKCILLDSHTDYTWETHTKRLQRSCGESNSKAASGACQQKLSSFHVRIAKRQNRILLFLWNLFRPGMTLASFIVAIQKGKHENAMQSSWANIQEHCPQKF